MKKVQEYDNREDKLLAFKIALIPYLMNAWKADNFEISTIIEEYNLLE